MSIDNSSAKTVNLPIDTTINQSDTTQTSNTLVDRHTPENNQIINFFSPELIQPQQNNLSKKIIESIASLDLRLKDSRREFNKSANQFDFNHQESKSAHGTKDSIDSHQYEKQSLNSQMENMKHFYQVSQEFRKSMLTVSFVQAYLTAFKNSLNKFLRM